MRETSNPARGRESLRERVYHLLAVEADDRGYERVLNILLLVLILANVGAVVLETVESFEAEHRTGLRVFEVASVAIFSLEYLLRLWSCTVDPRYAHPVVGRLKFAFSPMALIDLCAILPAYLPWILPVDLRFARALRLFRLARSLKIARYSQALHTLGTVVRGKREELGVTALLGCVLLLTASSLMYFVEHDAQPKSFSSIPASMWWGVVTLTTVGYGDIYPVTPLGKLLAGAIGIIGIGLFALPAGIVASGFSEEIAKRRAPRCCPHCGQEIG